MKYHSTRNRNLTALPSQAVLQGIAPDGGLYIGDVAHLNVDWREIIACDAQTMSAKILHAMLPDFPDMAGLIRRSYAGKFESSELTPLVQVGDRYVLELFRGPTSAFKDVALSVLPHLVTEAQKVQHQDGDVVILTATSGDTGKAALEGFHDVPGTRIVVFYPYGGVSAVQQLQMTTQAGGNVKVCAVRGNFDDAQTGVKNVFAACAGRDLGGAHLSSANSINIGRLAPQVMYYFKAYGDLVKSGRIAAGDKVHFVVPTGNFGDILAGYFAKKMGLPVGMLVCASNRNNVLTEFFDSGLYSTHRLFFKTKSPSMDILVSSNLERLLFEAADRDGELVKAWMGTLRDCGSYNIGDQRREWLANSFWGGCADDHETLEEIGKRFTRDHYLMDPHTAVASRVLGEYRIKHQDSTPTVLVCTASPYKFSRDVLAGIAGAEEASGMDAFACSEELERRSGVRMPDQVRNLQHLPVRHRAVCDASDMGPAVLREFDA